MYNFIIFFGNFKFWMQIILFYLGAEGKLYHYIINYKFFIKFKKCPLF